MNGVTPTHRALGPSHAQPYHIITHILLPQSSSYQRVTLINTLVLYAILNKIQISFAYLMMRQMFDCIKSDKNISLSYGIFLTCIFEYFGVDLSNEPEEKKFSSLKGGGTMKQSKKKSSKTTKDTIMEETKDESLPPYSVAGTSSLHKYLINGIVKDVLQEFVNMTKQMVNSSQQSRRLALQNKKSLLKSHIRVEVLLKYLDSLDEDQVLTESEEENLGTEDGSSYA
ncbi:hypothetical protein AHAS_Ahas13G0252300 [Arachis hypogaea]